MSNLCEKISSKHLCEFIKSLSESKGKEHFNTFKNSLKKENIEKQKKCCCTQWKGRPVKAWWESVQNKLGKSNKYKCEKLTLPAEAVERKYLHDICKKNINKNKSSLKCLITIMAWGGMRVDHGEMLFSKPEAVDYVIDIIQKLRKGNMKHLDAYEKFHKARTNPIRKENKIEGMGVAFFTKIIFFCNQNKNKKYKGYIMDQWVAKSINLLANKKIVTIQSNNYVNDSNKKCNYKHFCDTINCLKKYLCKKHGICKSGEQIEMALFSKGGKKCKWLWRKHVVGVYSDAKKDFAKADPCTCGNKK